MTKHDKARKLGEYHCKFYVRRHEDAKKKPTKNCRYWPLIYELRSNDTLGSMCSVRPNQAEDLIRAYPRTRAWYELDINLAEDGLVGPFNFDSNYRINEKVWTLLKEEAELQDVDTDDLEQIIPLQA